MEKLKWVIDANILGNVCPKNTYSNTTRKFLTQVKEHSVLMNREVINEYLPMPDRKNLGCEEKDKYFLREWFTELINKFGKPCRNLPELPLCVSRLVGKRFKKEDCIYVRLALSNEDKLLVATETHFQNIKCLLEENSIHMFDEEEALDYINHLSE